MASLPPELWHLIAGEVYATEDMSAILAMCLWDPIVQGQTNRWLQHVTLSMGKPHEIMGFASRLPRLSANHISSLTILACERVADNLPSGTLEQLVSRLSKLRTLDWCCSLPAEYLLANTRQGVLSVQNHHGLGSALDSMPLLNVQWTNLNILSMTFDWNDQTKDGNPKFWLGQMLILNAPNLQHLSVKIRYPKAQNYSVNSLSAFEFTRNRTLPPLRTLVLHQYSVGLGQHWLEHGLQVSFLRELTLEIGPHSHLYLFLETLMRGGNLCLKVLDIYELGWCGSLSRRERQVIFRRFLQSFKGLKKLVMRGSERFPYHPVVDAINWHGDTLETLVLYDPVGTPTTWRGSVEELTVTAEVVQKLSLRCTRLRALTLYLHFCTDIGLQQSFHQFQALEKLTIYSPLRRAAKEYLEPRVDDAYVSKLAVQVRSPLLREFTLYVGQETPRTSPLYIRHHKWENEHRMVWHVKYPQNDNQDASMMIWESVG